MQHEASGFPSFMILQFPLESPVLNLLKLYASEPKFRRPCFTVLGSQRKLHESWHILTTSELHHGRSMSAVCCLMLFLLLRREIFDETHCLIASMYSLQTYTLEESLQISCNFTCTRRDSMWSTSGSVCRKPWNPKQYIKETPRHGDARCPLDRRELHLTNLTRNYFW